jgi:hypothetical protein
MEFDFVGYLPNLGDRVLAIIQDLAGNRIEVFADLLELDEEPEA